MPKRPERHGEANRLTDTKAKSLDFQMSRRDNRSRTVVKMLYFCALRAKRSICFRERRSFPKHRSPTQVPDARPHP